MQVRVRVNVAGTSLRIDVAFRKEPTGKSTVSDSFDFFIGFAPAEGTGAEWAVESVIADARFRPCSAFLRLQLSVQGCEPSERFSESMDGVVLL